MADTATDAPTMSGVIPYLAFSGRAAEALAFYERAFGATHTATMPDAGDPTRLMHGQTIINGGAVMLTDHMGGDAASGSPASEGPLPSGHLQLVVTNGKAWWDRALAAGCTVVMPYERQFWGDEWGLLSDPFGVRWGIMQDGSAESAAGF
jgi:PhnB protein